MAPRPSITRQLLELAEDTRAAALAVGAEHGISPALRRLDEASRALLARLHELDQDQMDTIYLLQHATLSEWRLRQRRELQAVTGYDPEAA